MSFPDSHLGRIGAESGLQFPHLTGGRPRECDSVAIAALEHWGKTYKITRELDPTTVDCSTVVSQAHWVGAAVQTPFIAESQRIATNGIAVDLDDLLPGDAIFAYSSLDHEPDRHHNHVALYLGSCSDGQPWVIESREGAGVVLSNLSEVRVDGGARRFCPNPLERFPLEPWQSLVRLVPKLGRLGARLTSRYTGENRHRGTDIYLGQGSEVISPFEGEVVDLVRVGGSAVQLHLWSVDRELLAILSPLELRSTMKVGSQFETGAFLGYVGGGGAARANCNSSPGQFKRELLHLELWASGVAGSPSPSRGMRSPDVLQRMAANREFEPYNAMYAFKIGLIGAFVRWPVLVVGDESKID
jgi:hypothetical protein